MDPIRPDGTCTAIFTSPRLFGLGVLLVIGMAGGMAGCAEGPVKADPAVAEQLRALLQLSEEPVGAQTPLDWRESLGELDPAVEKDAPILLMGRVGGMPNPWPETETDFPWRRGTATFFLVDPATADEFAEHAGEDGAAHAADCPFCAREAASKANAVAAVTFLGTDGKAAGIDARELFGLSEGDTVVVRGKAKLLGDELLVVEADGLFRR
ncbi:hypothetical protein [Botrimarina hoheduenensis]|nr:hypothetical protein [Botrimarina hoheduenensis]